MGHNLSNFRAGDNVMIGITDVEVIEQMQVNHGGWNDRMKECMNGPCILLNGLGTDVLVKAPSGTVFRLNPDILTKYISSDLDKCGRIVVMDVEEEMKQLQCGHGGWSDGMKVLLGQTVEIVEKLPDGDYKVSFAGRIWTINPECFVLKKKVVMRKVSEGDKVKVLSDRAAVMACLDGHGGWSELMSLFLGQVVEVVKVFADGDCYVRKYGMNWMFNPHCFENMEGTLEKEEKNILKVQSGDRVRVIGDMEMCKELQKSHGEWLPIMDAMLGQTGVVDAVLSTGDARVTIGGVSTIFNVKCLTKIDQDPSEVRGKEVLKEGDTIKLISDEGIVKELQNDHGEWEDSMRLFLGEKGTVMSVAACGDLKVQILGSIVTLNPKCVTKLNEGDIANGNDDSADRTKVVPCVNKPLGKEDLANTDGGDVDDLNIILRPHQIQLFVAVKCGDLTQTRALLEVVGANVTLEKITPLLVAVSEGHESMVGLLLSNGAQVNVKNPVGDTPLHVAVIRNRLEICRMLVSVGANVNEGNDHTLTPVMVAAVLGVQDILHCILSASSVDLTIVDKNKDTALHLAIQHSRLDSVETLLDAGADASIVNKKLLSSFHLAALRGQERILDAILKKSGPLMVDSQKEDKFAAVHLAAINNHSGCIRTLIKYKADLNIRTNKLQTALHIAVNQRYLDCVKVLVEHKADMNLKDVIGATPLHAGMMGYHVERLRAVGGLPGMSHIFQVLDLIKTGSDSHEDIVLYLAKSGARIDIKNNAGQTALDICLDEVLKAKLLSLKDNTYKVDQPKPLRDIPTICPTNISEEEVAKLRLEIAKLEEEKLCKICCDRRIECTLPCGHVTCEACAGNLFECHICRRPIDTVIKMYR